MYKMKERSEEKGQISRNSAVSREQDTEDTADLSF